MFLLKTKYQTDKAELENKISNVSNLVNKTKVTELENKIPDLSSLATKTALTAVENKIPSVSMTQKSLKLNKNILILIMTSILQLQSLILWLLFLMQD